MKFADTSWWVAWSRPQDARHDDAVKILASLARNEQLLTTNHVVGESWTFMRRKHDHASCVALLDRIDALGRQHRLVVHRVTDVQEQAAWDWLRRRDERVYSFVDATSFRVMHDRRLREVFSFDHDFTAAGFVEVRP